MAGREEWTTGQRGALSTAADHLLIQAATKLPRQNRRPVGQPFVQFFFRLKPKFIVSVGWAMVFFPDFLRSFADFLFCGFAITSPNGGLFAEQPFHTFRP
jgi:hypothetical protein